MKNNNLLILIIFIMFTSMFELNIFAQIKTQYIQGREYKNLEVTK